MEQSLDGKHGCLQTSQTSQPLWIWLLASSVLVTACLTHTYAAPFLAYEPERVHPCVSNASKAFSPLATTLYHDFDPEAYDRYHDLDEEENCEEVSDAHHNYYHHDEESLCCMMSLKMVFMAGYAFGQIGVALVSDQLLSQWTCLRALIKTLILSGMMCSIATNVYFFAVSWFFVAFTASSNFLIIGTHLLERLEERQVQWKSRFLAGLLFQLNWTLSRFLAGFIVYFSNHWMTVMVIMTLIISAAYFGLEGLIWNEETRSEPRVKPIFLWPMAKTFLSLTFCWFTICLNFYGILHSWCKISPSRKKFEHDVLSTLLGLVAEGLACILCLGVRRKGLPLFVLQLFSAICYFCMNCIELEDKREDDNDLNWPLQGSHAIIYVAHINIFLETAAFALLWLLTLEAFPRNLRLVAVGLCSGFGKLGAIAGVVLGEYKHLHLNKGVIVTAGALTLSSAFVLTRIPDYTRRETLPKNVEELQND